MRVSLLLSCLATVTWFPVETAAACGGEFTSKSGVLKSPNFPKKYPHKSHCIYNVLASADARLKLTCKKMNIELSKGCVNDYLKVNGVIYCGKNGPKNVYAEGKLTLEFVTNGFKNLNKGFSCKFERVTGGPYVATTTTTTTDAPTTSSTLVPTSTTVTSTIVPSTTITSTLAPTTSTTALPTTAVTPVTIPITSTALPTTSVTSITIPTTSTALPTTSVTPITISTTSTALPTTSVTPITIPTTSTALPTTPVTSTTVSTTISSSVKPNTTITSTSRESTRVSRSSVITLTATDSPISTATHLTTEGTGSCSNLLTEKSSWNTGWNGKINLPVRSTVTSWRVDFHFTSPISSFEQWTGQTKAQSNAQYSVSKENSPLSAGDTLSFDFLYRYNEGSTVPSISSITLNDDDVCNGHGGTIGSTEEQPTTMPRTTVTHQPYTGPGCASEGSTYNYDEVLHKSLLFYEAQRSGYLPTSQRVTWRKDSATDDAIDSKTNQRVDLVGGYYDAGDYVKFGFPMASMTTILAWGGIEYGAAYTAAGEMSYLKEAVKWSTDYFIKAHPEANVFYGQVGLGDLDHAYWGRPEDMTMSRPAFKLDTDNPGSDLAGETAAALASASILFKKSDPSYSATCLQHAKELYNFANKHQGKYSDSITDAAKFYKSWGGYKDELAWAAAWLYRASGNTQYYADAKQHYSGLSNGVGEFSWDEKTPGVQVLLAEYADEDDKTLYLKDLEIFCDRILDDKPKTPKGLVFISKWGSLRYAANAVFICLRAADLGLKTNKYQEFGKKQIHYMLGDGGRSYVVGFGNNPPKSPHHSSSSCPLAPSPCGWTNFNSEEPNVHELTGALVGGPDANDNYEDKRNDYISNEVTTDYNAGFQSAIAALRLLANCNNSFTYPSTSQSMTDVTSSSKYSDSSSSSSGGLASTTTIVISKTSMNTNESPLTSTIHDITSSISNGVLCDKLLIESSSWNTGWSGKLEVLINTSINSWTITFVFTAPISKLEQWIGQISDQSDTEYSVSKDNSPLSAGDTLSFDFLYRFIEGSTVPSISSIMLNGKTVCGVLGGGTSVSTEQASKTETPSTTIAAIFNNCVVVKEINQWASNVQLQLEVTFSVQVDEWQIVLTFSETIDGVDAYTALEAVSGSTVTLSNESYNGNHAAGSSLILGMQVIYSTTAKPVIKTISVGNTEVCFDYKPVGA